ncbi:hypothetical protein RB6776 [Rhodopirellula baltica SH 1]|uniref:Uncharacterized protein n=1 Tax=Rhodopirellula baltica (strain DSM 10527 / NCIMB 13988 / SH1) TaxID=243090 RepID=Q7UPR2_RHOBA|nr:hypothetical protein RB6776 [Rhodopirellula baltica SH 1]
MFRSRIRHDLFSGLAAESKIARPHRSSGLNLFNRLDRFSRLIRSRSSCRLSHCETAKVSN